MQQCSPFNMPARSRVDRFMLLLAVSLLGLAGVTLVAAPEPAKDVELAWQRNWKNYARRCVKIRDTYYTCAAFETGFPSSRGISTVGLRQKTTKEVTDRTGANLKIKRHLVKPNEEIDAGAKTLPEIAVGHYGSIHSAEVLDVLGPDEMVVAGIWLLDAKQVQVERENEKDKLSKLTIEKGDITLILDWKFEIRDGLLKKQSDRSFRTPVKLRGFSTVGVSKGDRWTGKDGSPQIAIVGVEIPEQKSKTRRPTPLIVAIPVEQFMKPISEEKDFLAFLESRGFTKEKFVELLLEEKRINGTDDRVADAFIFAKLDGRGDEKEEEKPAVKPKERTKPSF